MAVRLIFMESLDRDLALAALSRRQFGATSTAQLIRIGFTPSSIRRAVERRRLVRVLPRVYRIVSVPVTLEQRLMSALLFGGDDAVLSHSTAAIVHDLIPRRPSAIHIATSRRVASRTGVIVHRRVWLPGDPPVRLGPLVVTSPARTVLDLCGVKNWNSEMALDAALRMGKASFADLDLVLEIGSKHRVPGTASLRALVSERGEEEAMSESELESSVIRVLRKSCISLPERQVTVDWEDCHRLDFCYPAHNLIIEVDGRKWHASRKRFERDRRRDNAVSFEGKRVIRFTWTDVMRDESYVVRTVKRALGIQELPQAP
jgi:very-short-patch-repair endonuclease